MSGVFQAMKGKKILAIFCATLLLLILVAVMTGWPPTLARLLAGSDPTNRNEATTITANLIENRSVVMSRSSAIAPAANINVQSSNQRGGITVGVIGSVNQQSAK